MAPSRRHGHGVKECHHDKDDELESWQGAPLVRWCRPPPRPEKKMMASPSSSPPWWMEKTMAHDQAEGGAFPPSSWTTWTFHEVGTPQRRWRRVDHRRFWMICPWTTLPCLTCSPDEGVCI